MMMNCEEVRMSLGAYALGALEPEERVFVEAHLAECDGCRAEFEELTGVVAFLGRVSEEDVTQAASPPQAVLDRLLNAKVRRRRITRMLLSLAASVLVVGLGGTLWAANRPAQDGGATMAQSQEPAADRAGTALSAKESAPSAESGDARILVGTPAPGRRLERRGDEGPVQATVTATEREGTITVRIVLSGVARGTPCRLDVIGADGVRQTAGNWVVDRAAYDKSIAFPGTTTIPLGSIAKFEIVTAQGRMLLSIPAR
ncbi:zf-HC2 domain-containing protein [Streptosporangium sp. NPDC006007]|uniref:anti-sigma factor family protein n=1 Tax=Streptosporangium sp. NPDC006007 TaxID=3154575 RepID=UPI0033B3CE3B